jgi:hypothetical protein
MFCKLFALSCVRCKLVNHVNGPTHFLSDFQMFTDAERLKLQEGIDDYNNKFLKYPCLRIYKEIDSACS